MDTQKLRKEFAARAAHLREYFVDTTPTKAKLDNFVEAAAKELDAKQIKLDEMFKLYDELGIGMIYKNSLHQYLSLIHI